DVRRREQALAARALRYLEVHIMRVLRRLAVEAEPAELGHLEAERPGHVRRGREQGEASLLQGLDMRAAIGEEVGDAGAEVDDVFGLPAKHLGHAALELLGGLLLLLGLLLGALLRPI